MNSHTHGSSAARAGARLGRVWMACIRQEARIARWMVERGISPLITKLLLWMLKLAVFATLLYASLWLVLVLLLVVAVARSADNLDLDTTSPRPEWRNGVSGFGLYSEDGYRIDPHDIHDEKQE